MTPSEYAEELRRKAEEIKRTNRPFKLAVYSTVARSSQRIFDRGVTADGQSFKYNDTTPLYIADSQAKNKGGITHKGKTGRSVFESGKKAGQRHKTTYFSSYRELRAAQGLETNHVNWTFIGDLKSDFLNTKVGAPTSSAEPVRVNLNEYIQVTRGVNVEKYEGLSKRYGQFLNVSPEEIQEFYDTLNFELAQIFNP